MNIQEAARLAVETGALIARPTWKGHVHMWPTGGPDCRICYGKGKAPGPRWQPQAEDLMADDWEVTFDVLDQEQARTSDSIQIMNTEQPGTITFDGVEVPSYYLVWKKFKKFDRRLKTTDAFLGALFGITTMALLLRLWM